MNYRVTFLVLISFVAGFFAIQPFAKTSAAELFNRSSGKVGNSTKSGSLFNRSKKGRTGSFQDRDAGKARSLFNQKNPYNNNRIGRKRGLIDPSSIMKMQITKGSQRMPVIYGLMDSMSVKKRQARTEQSLRGEVSIKKYTAAKLKNSFMRDAELSAQSNQMESANHAPYDVSKDPYLNGGSNESTGNDGVSGSLNNINEAPAVNKTGNKNRSTSSKEKLKKPRRLFNIPD